MDDVVIRVENLSKRYRIGSREEMQNTFVGAALSSLRKPFGNLRNLRRLTRFNQEEAADDIIWALKDVSFEVKRGEILGIIGRNGAGKSTLLKILSRITYPTEGRVELKGRVSSLLEVGTGFHRELTGRENIYLNGAILGMTKGEIDSKFDEIVDFSGVEKFIDTPVKHYSSGMYVRLAFAVAAHLEPEILLVDEVLAVGDAEFQKKCLGKMGEVAEGGRTVLFVSHNMLAMETLCKRIILLNEGLREMDGDVHDVISNYLKSEMSSLQVRNWLDQENAPGNDLCRIKKVEINSENGTLPVIKTSESFSISIDYWILRRNSRIGITLRIINEQNLVIFSTSSGNDPESPRNCDVSVGLYRSIVNIPENLFNSGEYYINLLIVGPQVKNFEYSGIVAFEVVQNPNRIKPWYGRPVGVIHPELEWKTERQ